MKKPGPTAQVKDLLFELEALKARDEFATTRHRFIPRLQRSMPSVALTWAVGPGFFISFGAYMVAEKETGSH